MRLNHNTLAYAANSNLNAINNNLTRSMERLSSGYKVNKSSDDPAAYAISQKMQAQIDGLKRATNNANDGISMIQTGEGALNEVHSILERIRELTVQAANETYDEEDKDAMQAEIKQMQAEIDRIAETTDFNGRKLLNGELNKKGYVDTDNLSIVEIGGDIDPGKYGITVTGTGTQAQNRINVLPDNYVVPKANEGTLLINNFEIEIKEGMTGAEVNSRIRNAAYKIGIDYNMQTGALTTQEYGSKQSITVKSANDNVAALFGATGKTAYGSNAEAQFTQQGGARVGFKDTATIETQGNRITVTDKNGFKMVYDVEPGSAATAAVTANITVLSAGPMVFQVGSDEGQVMNVNIGKTTVESLGIDKINIYTNAYATDALGKIDDAIVKVSDIRSALGAIQNRLDYTVTNLETADENLTSAVSRIKDTDMAEEITEYTERNVLSQSALQMLTRSNARPEGLLQLFQR